MKFLVIAVGLATASCASSSEASISEPVSSSIAPEVETTPETTTDASASTAPRATSSTSASEPDATVAAGDGPCGLAIGEDITFPAGRDDQQLHGVLAGAGTTAIVLAHEAGQDACAWRDHIAEFADADLQVLAIDLDGSGESDRIADRRLDLDVLAGVAEVRARGAQRVVVIGASKGATGAFAAAGQPDNGIDGVVSLSAVAEFSGTDALAAAPSVTVPVLFAASERDEPLPDTALELDEACGCGVDVLIFEGSRHGIAMLDPAAPDSERLRKAIDTLIATVSN